MSGGRLPVPKPISGADTTKDVCLKASIAVLLGNGNFDSSNNVVAMAVNLLQFVNLLQYWLTC